MLIERTKGCRFVVGRTVLLCGLVFRERFDPKIQHTGFQKRPHMTTSAADVNRWIDWFSSFGVVALE
jgi:hypothetical protein